MSQKLGRYRLVKLLATGGMGEVFLARHEGPGGFAKMVVVKRILKHLAQDQGFIDLFLNEARLAAQLQHPNIAQVFGLEHEDHHWFMAMEYVHGHSLRDVLDRAFQLRVTVPPPIAARLASQALQGLHYAHSLTDERGRPLGILHRDVSPENLLVSWSGLVKLVDFGIARAMTGSETRVGRPKGKLAYMAPELTVSGAVVDRRADVYAVGVVLHELLTLTRPACVPETVDALALARQDHVPQGTLPAGLEDILVRALRAVPDARYDSAQDMSAALEGWLLGTGRPVLPADLTAWLAGLFGAEQADTNPAVVHLGRGAGRTDLMQGLAAPVGTAPLTADSGVDLPRVTPPSSRWALWLAGGTTFVVMAVTLAVALWPRPPVPAPQLAPVPVPPVVVPEAAPVVVPEVDLRPVEPVAQVLDAGPRPRPHAVGKTGKVSLRVNPWAEVSVGGRRLGVTPLEPFELPVGVARVTLTNPQLGVTRVVPVKVVAGQTAVVKVDLFPH